MDEILKNRFKRIVDIIDDTIDIVECTVLCADRVKSISEVMDIVDEVGISKMYNIDVDIVD